MSSPRMRGGHRDDVGGFDDRSSPLHEGRRWSGTCDRSTLPPVEWLASRLFRDALSVKPTHSKGKKAINMLLQLLLDFDAQVERTVSGVGNRELRILSRLHVRRSTTSGEGHTTSQLRMSVAEKYLKKLVRFFEEWRSHLDYLGDSGLVRLWSGGIRLIERGIELHHSGEHVLSIDSRLLKSDEDLLDVASDMLAHGALCFPWKRLVYGKFKHSMMEELRAFTMEPFMTEEAPHNVYFKAVSRDGDDGGRGCGGKKQLLPFGFDGGKDSPLFYHEVEHYTRMDVVTDIFQEQQRLRARRQDQRKSPLEQWSDPHFVKGVLRRIAGKTDHVDVHMVREEVYESVRECTQFKPSLAKAVMSYFGARTVLDMSAGWGDRLIGAIAADVDAYDAYDPNTDLRDGHQAIIEAFVPEHKRSRYSITYEGFERAELEPCRYDLMFSSPPFFDFEVYTSLPGQSVDSHPNIDAWIVRFLFVCLRIAWRAIKQGGHCVVHITDVFTTKVCERMCLLVCWILPQVRYRGAMVSSGVARKLRPMWVFQKVENTNETLANACKLELEGLWPETYKEAQKLLSSHVPPDGECG